MRYNFRYIYERTRKLTVKPEEVWAEVASEYHSEQEIFKTYLIPLAAVMSVPILLSYLIQGQFILSIEYALINLLSATTGTWLAYLITREFIAYKFHKSGQAALNLTVYSATVFVAFRSLGAAFDNKAIEQLFTLVSLIFFRTLHSGIIRYSGIEAKQRTNTLIIIGLSIICMPAIVKQILKIILGIPTFNL